MSAALPSPVLPALRGGPALGWAVLAPGRIATAFATALTAHTDHRIVAVGSRDGARAEEFAARFGIPRAFSGYEAAVAAPGVDAVYIAAPHTLHLPLARIAFAVGRHALIEKPLAATAADARAIAREAAQAGVLAMEAMWTRFHPWVSVADSLIVDGAIGEVRTIGAEIGRPFPAEEGGRLFDPELGGGALRDMGVYAVFVARHFGGPPLDVVAGGTRTESGVDAQSTLAVGLRGGGRATVSSTLECFTPSRAFIAGPGGSLRVDGRFPMPGDLGWYGPDGEHIATYRDETGLTGHAALARQAAWMAEHIADGLRDSPLHPLADAVGQIETVERALAQF